MLTFAETCAELRISPKTLRKLIQSGDLAAVKIGGGRWSGAYRISEEALAEFLRQQTVKPTAS
jgi:excisionase family DNA binding protein